MAAKPWRFLFEQPAIEDLPSEQEYLQLSDIFWAQLRYCYSNSTRPEG